MTINKVNNYLKRNNLEHSQTIIAGFLCFALLYLTTLIARPYMGDFILKALPIGLLCLLAYRFLAGINRILAVCALLFSACGDVLLALPVEHSFAAGLGAFLCAHLVYIAAFLHRFSYRTQYWPIAIGLSLFAITAGLLLVPATGILKPAVTVYLVIITVMGITAVFFHSSRLLIAGALCFITSDTVLAVNEFLIPLSGASYSIMITYYLAQLLITLGLCSANKSNQSELQS